MKKRVLAGLMSAVLFVSSLSSAGTPVYAEMTSSEESISEEKSTNDTEELTYEVIGTESTEELNYEVISTESTEAIINEEMLTTTVETVTTEVVVETSESESLEDSITTGVCGANNGISWSYNESTKTLTLTGEDTYIDDEWVEDKFVSQIYNICSDVECIIFSDVKLNRAGNLLSGLSKLSDVRFDNFDTSDITDMHSMFRDCSSLTSLDLSSFDTSNVTDMGYMFSGCSSLTNLDLSSFDTSNVTSMWYMFYNCGSLINLNVSSFNTSDIADMSYMFYNCNNLTNLDLSNFDTSNVTNMWYLFSRCNNLTYLNLNNFNTSNVTNMECMFSSCYNLTSLDLNSFNTTNVKYMGSMFSGCSSLKNLNVSGFDTTNVTDMGAMFYNCNSLTNLDLSNFNTSNVDDMQMMFGDCSSLVGLDVSNFDTANVTSMSNMFSGCSSLVSLDVSNFDTANVTSMNHMFSACNSLTSLDLCNFDTSNVKYMEYVFSGCGSLINLNISSFDTTNVTDMTAMFYACNSLTNLNLSNFNTSNVSDMQLMFRDCSSLITLNVNNFDTSNVFYMGNMFLGCTSLEHLDLSSFDISNVRYMDNMLSRMSALNEIKTPAIMSEEQQISLPVTFVDEDMNEVIKITSEQCGKILRVIIGVSSLEINPSMVDLEIGGTLQLAVTITPSNATNQNIIWKTSAPSIASVSDDGLVTALKAGKVTIMAETQDGSQIKVSCTVNILGDEGEISGFCGENDGISWLYNQSTKTLTLTGEDTYIEPVKNGYFYYSPFYNICSDVECVIFKDVALTDYTNYLLSGLDKLTEVQFDNFDTSNISYMRYMFADCSSLTSLNLNGLNTASVVNMEGMFSGCSSLENLDLSSFDTSKVYNMDSMFSGCTDLISINLNSFNTSKVYTMIGMFSGCSSLESLDLNSFNTSKAETMYGMFSGCCSLRSLDLSSFDTSGVTIMGHMFYDCSSLTTLNINNFNTSKVRSTVSMFENCSSLTSLDLSNFDTSNVEDMFSMFSYCTSLENLNLTSFNTSKAEDIERMFEGCSSLTSLDLSSFDTSNVTDMGYMFFGCTNLENLDLSSFDTSKASYIDGLLNDLPALKEIKTPAIMLGNQGIFLPGIFIDADMNEVTAITSAQCNKTLTKKEISINNIEVNVATAELNIGEILQLLVIITPMDATNQNIEWTSSDTSIATVSEGGLVTALKAGTVTITAETQDGSKKSASCLVEVIDKETITTGVCGANNGITWSYNESIKTLTLTGEDTYIESAKDSNGISVSPFYNICRDVECVIFKDVTLTSSALYLLSGLNNLSEVQFDNFDTSKVTIMGDMFSNCNSLVSLDLSCLNTSNVTYMGYMFFGCSALEELDLSNFNTSKVSDMGMMFNGCKSLTNLDLSNLDTSNVTNMHMMFNSCNNLTSLDLSSFDTSNVTNMGHMFSGCSSLMSLDLSNFNTSATTTMAHMFGNCSSLTNLILDHFTTSSVTDMSTMFSGCNSLVNLDLSSFDTSKVTNMGSMFSGCSSLVNLGLSSFDTSKVTYMGSMFSECSNLVSLDLSSFNTSQVTSMEHMFSSCSSLVSLNISSFNTSNVTDMGPMFIYCSSLANLDLSNFDTSKVTDMRAMFNGCSSLVSLDLSSFDTSNVRDMGSMFSGCSSLVGLNLSNFDTSRVGSMDWMFNRCYSLENLDLSNFNTTSATDMSAMFYLCSDLKSLNISNFNTSKVVDMSSMFAKCSSLEQLNLNSFDTSNVASMVNMMEGMASLAIINTPSVIVDNRSISLPDTFADENENKVTEITSELCGKTLTVKPASVTTGFCGENNGISWSYNEVTKTLTLTGEDTYIEPAKDYYGDKISPFSKICKDVKFVKFKDIKLTSSAEYLLCGLNNLYAIQFDNFDTSGVTSMRSMFDQCLHLTNLDLSNFDTSNVTDMSYMFRNCQELVNLKLSDFDTSNVTSMAYMFSVCNSLQSLDLSSFDTSNVTDMAYMFNYCQALDSLDLDNFNTSNVVNMEGMFRQFGWVQNLDLSKFDTSNVTNMNSMFFQCYLYNLNLNNFNTANVTDMNSMFFYCSNLESLNLSNFNITNVIDIEHMLEGMSALNKINAPSVILDNQRISLPDTFVDKDMSEVTEITVSQSGKTLIKKSNIITDLKLNKIDMELVVGKTLQLLPIITPVNAANQDLIWTSSDTSIATVSEDGLVTALKIGTAIISAKSTDGSNKSASCTVKVLEEIDENPIDKLPYNLEFTLVENMTTRESATISVKATDGTEEDRIKVLLTLADVNGTTLQEKGVVLKSGDAYTNTITFSELTADTEYIIIKAVFCMEESSNIWVENGSKVYDYKFKTKESIIPTSIELSEEIITLNLAHSGEYLDGFDYKQLTALLQPQTAVADLLWTSSNPNVATVNSDGLVTATGIGEAVITVASKFDETVNASCNIIVKNYVVFGDNIDSQPEILSYTTILKGNSFDKFGYYEIKEDGSKTLLTDYTVTPLKSGIVTYSDNKLVSENVGTTQVIFEKDGIKTAITVMVYLRPVGFGLTDIQVNNSNYSEILNDDGSYTVAFEEGVTYTLIGETSPINSFAYYQFEWETSDSSIATVAQNGVVTPISTGRVTITITPKGNPEDIPYTQTNAQVTLNIKKIPSVESVTSLYAITNTAIKLEQIALPTTLAEEWTWKNPSTSLVINGINKEAYNFELVSTNTEYYPLEMTIPVYIGTITGLNIAEVEGNHKQILQTGSDSMKLSVDIVGQGTISNEMYEIEIPEVKGLIITKGEDGYYTITAEKAGTYTLKPVVKVNGKAIKLKKATTYKITTVDASQAVSIELSTNTEGVKIENNKITFESIASMQNFNLNATVKDRTGAELETKLQWKVSDNTVAKVTADKKDSRMATITAKGEGYAVITVIAQDKMKHQVTLDIEIQNHAPRVNTNKAAVNIAYDYTDDDSYSVYSGRYMASTAGLVEIVPVYNESIMDIQLFDKAGENLVTELALDSYKDYSYLVIPTKEEIPTGKYVCTLRVTTSENVSYDYPLTITVSNKLPTIKVKTNNAINLFYTDTKAEIYFSVSNNAKIENVTWEDNSPEKDNGFTLKSNSNVINCISVSQENLKVVNGKLKDKNVAKGTLVFELEGYRESCSIKNFTIKYNYKKPNIVSMNTSSTVAPTIGQNENQFYLYNKTEKNYNLNYAELICNDENVDLSYDNRTSQVAYTYKGTKNSHKFTMTLDARVWRESINVTHTIKVKNPTPTLSNNNIVFNIAENLKDTANINVNIANVELTDIVVTGKNTKSQSLITNNLFTITTNEKTGNITVEQNDAALMNVNLSAGTYEYKVVPYCTNVSTGELVALKTLSFKVKVINKSVTAKVSTKGSIDLSKGANFNISKKINVVWIDPKLSNLATNDNLDYNIKLTGEYSKYFMADYAEGHYYITANPMYLSSLKAGQTYKLAVEYSIRNSEDEIYTVKSNVFNIKPQQSKPKVTITQNNQIMYVATNNLIRYSYISVPDYYTIENAVGNIDCNKDGIADIIVTEDENYGNICSLKVEIVNCNAVNTSTKGKTYTIPVTVKLEGRDGISKDATVNVKITVKR